MKRTIRFFSLCGVLFLFAACSESHFITNATYRSHVKQDLQQKKGLMTHGNVFSILENKALSRYEREALEFLYAYMSMSDITDYSGGFHLMNIRASQIAAKEMPWGKSIPEDIFRHFVLPVRVNNEHLDSARVVFYNELKNRVKSLPLYDAILEVNHWCHEKVIYTPSDGRTSSPLASVRTGFGRCGEESTFLVAALRSVGIPARQVYTPRWAHTDDNHAWVEAWANGKWYFLGACEPEPVLNLGWFNAPASRGMLMHTKVFGRYEGKEEIMSVTPNFTEINVIENYAPVAKGTVIVQDEKGKPVSGAKVEFKLYNYAEFYTVATKQTTGNGSCELTAGKGDMLVWASKGARFGFAKLSFGKQAQLTVVLDKKEGDTLNVDLDIVPPAENAVLPKVTPEQRAENTRRMAQEDSIRHAYTSTFLTDKSINLFLSSLQGKIDANVKSKLATWLKETYGNHAVVIAFLKEADRRNKLLKAITLLGSLSQKDRRDVRHEVLMDSFLHTPDLDNEVYSRYLSEQEHTADLHHQIYGILCPRVALEELTTYKAFFQKVIDTKTAEKYQTQPQKLISWCRDSIAIDNSFNSQHIPMSPEGVWKSRIADTRSRDIFFVSLARSLNIPAWIDEVTGKVQYVAPKSERYSDGRIQDVDFAGAEQTQALSGSLIARYQPTAVVENPKYYSHFTLSKLNKGSLQLLNYDEGNSDMGEGTTWVSLLKQPRTLDAGYYMLVSGTRLANGGVLARLSSVNIEANKQTATELVMREKKDEVQVIGNFNSESIFTPLNGNTKQSLLQVCGRGYFVVGILGTNQEPTNHALRDIVAVGKKLEDFGRKFVLLFPDKEQAYKYQADNFKGLPHSVLYGIDSDGISAQIAENMKLKNKNLLPIFIVADTFNRVVFVSQGYTIGLGEQLSKVLTQITQQ